MSDLVVARNCCCMARMLPGREEAENGVRMNRSVREVKKCRLDTALYKNYFFFLLRVTSFARR